jgi:hypothetical protein
MRDAALGLLTPEAVRERAHAMLDLARAEELDHWQVDASRLPVAADIVAAVTRAAYPDLAVPFHARWRHFMLAGQDRWAAVADRAGFRDVVARARAEFDLAIVSVLLDAGAGMAWRYRTADGHTLSRSEGLAIASLDLFAAGALSSAPVEEPLRADGEALAGFTPERLAEGFQVSADNPLVGVEGRTALLRALGRRVLAIPGLFARSDTPRPGGLFDVLAVRTRGGRLPAREILIALLEGLGPIWPGRTRLEGLDLGDTWRHPALRRGDATAGLVPFHKLSQWLAYSLIEPLQRAGVHVEDIDALTGLPEYRNGGLLVDAGVLVLKDPADAEREHDVGSPLVVEWRALTVALLDALAPLVRARLGVTAAAFPLARVLEGGTWAAGRKLARERRADGGPPIKVASDGTVF